MLRCVPASTCPALPCRALGLTRWPHEWLGRRYSGSRTQPSWETADTGDSRNRLHAEISFDSPSLEWNGMIIPYVTLKLVETTSYGGSTLKYDVSSDANENTLPPLLRKANVVNL